MPFGDGRYKIRPQTPPSLNQETTSDAEKGTVLYRKLWFGFQAYSDHIERLFVKNVIAKPKSKEFQRKLFNIFGTLRPISDMYY